VELQGKGDSNVLKFTKLFSEWRSCELVVKIPCLLWHGWQGFLTFNNSDWKYLPMCPESFISNTDIIYCTRCLPYIISFHNEYLYSSESITNIFICVLIFNMCYKNVLFLKFNNIYLCIISKYFCNISMHTFFVMHFLEYSH
jgi:hypothetical protein